MNITEICRHLDMSIAEAERELASLQAKGLITGFVPGDMCADIKPSAAALPYFSLSNDGYVH